MLNPAGESTAASAQGLGRSRVQDISRGSHRRKQLMDVHSQASWQHRNPGLSWLHGGCSSGLSAERK